MRVMYFHIERCSYGETLVRIDRGQDQGCPLSRDSKESHQAGYRHLFPQFSFGPGGQLVLTLTSDQTLSYQFPSSRPRVTAPG